MFPKIGKHAASTLYIRRSRGDGDRVARAKAEHQGFAAAAGNGQDLTAALPGCHRRDQHSQVSAVAAP